MFDFPNSPTVGQTVTGPNNIQFQWDGAKWVTVTPGLGGPFLPLAGGTLTGGIDITQPYTSGPNNTVSLAIDAPAGSQGAWIKLNSVPLGQGCGISTQKNGTWRWSMQLGDSAAESGSNAGSNFNIVPFSDTGSALTTALNINRATGTATFYGTGGVHIDGPAATNRSLMFTTNGVNRWLISGNASPESGSNNGSDLGFYAYNDAGTSIINQFQVVRSNGQATFSGPVAGASPPNGNPPSGGAWLIGGYVQASAWYNPSLAAVRNDGVVGLFWYNGGNQFTWSGATSDRRVKSNIKPAQSALGIVKDMPIYDLDYTPRFKPAEGYSEHVPERWPFSFIADEVAKTLPHATIKVTEDDGEHHVALHPHHLVAVLWKAVQELTTQNEALAARITALEGAPT